MTQLKSDTEGQSRHGLGVIHNGIQPPNLLGANTVLHEISNSYKIIDNNLPVAQTNSRTLLMLNWPIYNGPPQLGIYN